ncbi:MAG TPA: SRPBCC family protein [Acidimicrobiales bacterium]|nr:SRPBCC family protein [Acidimicrobiales bacterium]
MVRAEDRLPAPVDEVWSALTDPDRLARWLGRLEGDLRLGGEFRAHFHASGWEGSGRVAACEPQRRLLVMVIDEDEPDENPIEITLTPDGDGTVVVWEESGKPPELVAAYGAGIQIHVEDLADHVAGRDRRDAGPRFDVLFAAYRQRNGDPAGPQ